MVAVLASCSSDTTDSPALSTTTPEQGLGGLDAGSTCTDVDAARSDGSAIRSTAPDGAEIELLEVTAGDFRVGNFADVGGTSVPGAADFEAKIYWIPDDDTIAAEAALRVEVERLDEEGTPLFVRDFGGDGTSSFADGQYFWPSSVPLPASGRWRVAATAPGHQGCVELSI